MKQKTFIVDWDDYEQVSKLGNTIKSRLGEINPNRISKHQKDRNILDACCQIMTTDLTSLYDSLELDDSPIYYVYAHTDPSKKIAVGISGITTYAATLGMQFIPFYIGKGTGDRCYDTNRNETHRKIKQKLASFNKQIEIVKLFTGLTERQALSIESKLIDIFGLIPCGGLLTNLDEGFLATERRFLYKEQFLTLSKLNKQLSKLMG